MALILATPPSRRKYIRTPSSTRKRRKAFAFSRELASPVSCRYVGCAASQFPAGARNPAAKRLKGFAQASSHVRSTMSVKKYIAARYRWNALRLEWRLKHPHRSLSAHRHMSVSPRRSVSPSAYHKLPRLSTPESDFGDLQKDVNLLDSPSVERFAKKSIRTVYKEEPRMFVDLKAPVSLIDKRRREHSNVFFMNATPSCRASQYPCLVVEYGILTRNSPLCRDVLRAKRDGTLADPTNAIVYDPAAAIGKACSSRSAIQDASIYIQGLLESDIAKAQEYYSETKALKSVALWAGLTTFLDWARYDVIDFGKATEEDMLAAYYVGNFLGAPEEYLLALDV